MFFKILILCAILFLVNGEDKSGKIKRIRKKEYEENGNNSRRKTDGASSSKSVSYMFDLNEVPPEENYEPYQNNDVGTSYSEQFARLSVSSDNDQETHYDDPHNQQEYVYDSPNEEDAQLLLDFAERYEDEPSQTQENTNSLLPNNPRELKDHIFIVDIYHNYRPCRVCKIINGPTKCVDCHMYCCPQCFKEKHKLQKIKNPIKWRPFSADLRISAKDLKDHAFVNDKYTNYRPCRGCKISISTKCEDCRWFCCSQCFKEKHRLDYLPTVPQKRQSKRGKQKLDEDQIDATKKIDKSEIWYYCPLCHFKRQGIKKKTQVHMHTIQHHGIKLDPVLEEPDPLKCYFCSFEAESHGGKAKHQITKHLNILKEPKPSAEKI